MFDKVPSVTIEGIFVVFISMALCGHVSRAEQSPTKLLEPDLDEHHEVATMKSFVDEPRAPWVTVHVGEKNSRSLFSVLVLIT